MGKAVGSALLIVKHIVPNGYTIRRSLSYADRFFPDYGQHIILYDQKSNSFKNTIRGIYDGSDSISDSIVVLVLLHQFSQWFVLNIVLIKTDFISIEGLFCVFLGIIIFLSDLRFPDQTAEFFGIDVLQSYEEYFAGKHFFLVSKIDFFISRNKDKSRYPKEIQKRPGNANKHNNELCINK